MTSEPIFHGKVVATYTGIGGDSGESPVVSKRVACLMAYTDGLSKLRAGAENRRTGQRHRIAWERTKPSPEETQPKLQGTRRLQASDSPSRIWSAMSVEDSAAIAGYLGIARIDPRDFGINLLLAGVPSLSKLPNGTMLTFNKHNSQQVSLHVNGPSYPSRYAGNRIAARHQLPALASKYQLAASTHAGLIGKVATEGTILPGDEFSVTLPQYMFSRECMGRYDWRLFITGTPSGARPGSKF